MMPATMRKGRASQIRPVRYATTQKKIWANQFDSAQLALERTGAAGFDFGLLSEPDFTGAMEKYREKIMEQTRNGVE